MPIISANSINRFAFIKKTSIVLCDEGSGVLCVIYMNVNPGKVNFSTRRLFFPCTIVALGD